MPTPICIAKQPVALIRETLLSKATTKLCGNANTASNGTKIAAAIALIIVIGAAAFFVNNYTAPGHASENAAHVACVGDSITAVTGYPDYLQALLGNGSQVGNFGVSGSTVSLGSIEPYLHQNATKVATAFQPNVVVILLGTNDARADVYPYTANFIKDYKMLISQFQQLECNPKIYLALPPPVYENNINISSSHLTENIIPMVRQVAQENGLPLIDTYTPLLNHPDYFVDGVHPNSEGAKAIAQAVYQAIAASAN
jgi:lysophospholipase L1-like esterase